MSLNQTSYTHYRIRTEYLFSSSFVRGHVSVKLCSIGKGIAAERAAEVVLALLVSVFNVLLQ